MPDRLHPEAPKELERYLIPSERIVFEVHRNKVVLALPFISMIVVWVIALRVVGTAGATKFALIVAGLVTLWFLFALAEWHHELFLATDRRLMLVHGLVTRKVDIMPMAKVTDMRYDRTLPGYIFGYGKYVLESAGQDQALSEINFVPDPDRHYREISDVLFGSGQRSSAQRLVPTSTGDQLPVNEAENYWWKKP